MERLHNGFTLEICDGAFPFSTDSVALAAFAKLPKNAKVLDLGAGCGTLGLLLCARDEGCTVTGVEIDQKAHEMALHNAAVNKIPHRLTSLQADLKTVPQWMAPGSFDLCVSNPPYFTGGPRSKTLPVARQETSCDLESILASAAWALRYGGDFFLVHRPERLAEIFVKSAAHQLEPKRLQLLRHKEGGPVTLVLVALRKGGKPGLLWEEAALFHPDGSPTEDYRRLYHI